MEIGHHGHLGHRAVPNVFNIEEEHAQILLLENQMEDIVLEGIYKVEIVQMGFVKVCCSSLFDVLALFILIFSYNYLE